MIKKIQNRNNRNLITNNKTKIFRIYNIYKLI